MAYSEAHKKFYDINRIRWRIWKSIQTICGSLECYTKDEANGKVQPNYKSAKFRFPVAKKNYSTLKSSIENGEFLLKNYTTVSHCL